ncbi:MAG: hypothetical protein KatS3mg102_0027 [Planctomycetota bacterium]|nr:MAG: hypothetical protein KatS3mg102_0027 [Planctomycetota bacterium]
MRGQRGRAGRRAVVVSGAAALLAAVLAAAAPAARGWGLFAHLAIGDAAAQRLGLPQDERAWFVLGSLMGDLDKSDHLQDAIGGEDLAGWLLRWAARAGNAYRLAPVVDLHDPTCAAELCERAAATGDRRLVAWALGVMAHGIADRFTDTYPEPRYRVSRWQAEIAADVRIFSVAGGGRYRELLARIEREDQIVFGPPPHRLPARSRHGEILEALRRGLARDAAVAAADPFAALVLQSHRAVFGGRPAGASLSDLARQQIAFDAFCWNYRRKVHFMPGWRAFAQEVGEGWFRRVEQIALGELPDRIAATARAWQQHLERLATGAPGVRPPVP